MKNEAARAKTVGALYAQIHYIYKDMVAAGFPAAALATTYAIAQIMFESDWMTSNVANVDNNYSGITWLNASYQKATRGLPKPEGGYYAHFESFADYLRDYLRILCLNTGKQGRPIDATSAQQFIDRLRANHYFTDPNYHTKFNSALRKVSEALTWGNAQGAQWKDQYTKGQDTFTYTPGQGLTSNTEFDLAKWWTTTVTWARNNPLPAVAATAAVLLAVGVVKKALS